MPGGSPPQRYGNIFRKQRQELVLVRDQLRAGEAGLACPSWRLAGPSCGRVSGGPEPFGRDARFLQHCRNWLTTATKPQLAARQTIGSIKLATSSTPLITRTKLRVVTG